MANRLVRKTAILAKIETTYGVDPTPTGSANAMLVSNLSINPLNAQNVKRDNVRPYLGGSEELVGTHYVECGFDIELAGAGAAGSAPKWGPLMRACSMAETLSAGVSAEYTPISDLQESIAIYWYDDGLLHKVLGARGSFALKAGISERPVFSFKFTGIYVAPTSASNPSVTLTGFQKPLVITNTNTGSVIFGGTYAAAAVTGGTSYKSRGIPELDIGNVVSFIPEVGSESVDITDREATLKVELNLTAANEATFYGNVLTNTTQAVSLEHGNVAGNIVGVFMPNVQLISPKKADRTAGVTRVSTAG